MKKSIRLLVIIAIVIVNIVVFVPWESCFFRYETPEQAVEAFWSRQRRRNGEILGVIEDDNVALAIDREISRTDRIFDHSYKLVFRDRRGWISPTQRIILVGDRIRYHNGYTVTPVRRNIMSTNRALVIRETLDDRTRERRIAVLSNMIDDAMNDGQRMAFERSLDNITEQMYNVPRVQGDIRDNIGSNFMYIDLEGTTVWFVYFDEIPTGYTLILDGEELRIN